MEGRQVGGELRNENDVLCHSSAAVKHEHPHCNFRYKSETRVNANSVGAIDMAGNTAKSILRRRASNNLRRKLKDQLWNETYTFNFRPAELEDNEHATTKSSLVGALDRRFSRRPHTACPRKVQVNVATRNSATNNHRPQSASSIRESADLCFLMDDFLPVFRKDRQLQLKTLDVSRQRRSRAYRKAKNTVKNIDFDSDSETDSDEDIARLRAEIKELSLQSNI